MKTLPLKGKLLVCSLFFYTAVFSQEQQQIDSTLIKSDRHGKGNATFSLTVLALEKIVTVETRNKFETTLNEWISFGNFNEIGAEYDEATKNFTIPLYQSQK